MSHALLSRPTTARIDLALALQLFVLVDLLFFPRLLFAFGIPVSLLVVVFSMAQWKLQLNRLVWALAILAVMLASVAYGAISGLNVVPDESFKRALQLFTILFYSFYRVDGDRIRPHLVKILRFFYLWTFLAMLLFFLQPGLYQGIVGTVFPETLDQLENTLEALRFSYIYADPNSAAYLLCFTLVAYLNLESKLRWGVLCTTLAVVTILTTQSRGAYVGVGMILLFFAFSSRAARYKKVLVALGACMALFAVASYYSDDIELAYKVFDARFDQEEDLGGGRAGKYKYLAENFNLLPLGPGYHLVRDSAEFRPHSDLIRLNLGYGILALPLLFYFVFPRRRSQALLFVIFLIPFLINSVIDDYRLFGMYLLLYAILGMPPTQQTPAQALTER